jgi:endonuclease-3 related protein
MPSTAKILNDMYQAMFARSGHQKWWPGQTQLEICVGAILTQNTNWTNVEKALANLKQAGLLDVELLHRLDQARLAELIKPAGYFNIKAKRLKNFIARVHEYGGGDLGRFFDRGVSSLREDLLSVNGIGRETADSMILYAAGKATFVVDTYTYRILLRHRIIVREDDYEAIKELMESNLDRDAALWNDYHAQLVMVGKTFCRPSARCEGCPLEAMPHDCLAGTVAGDE